MASSTTPVLPGMKPGETIHKFLERKIRPDTEYVSRCSKVVDSLARSLEQSPGPLNVKRILKSGSVGKGTAVKEKSDIDLVIFLSDYSSVKALSDDSANVLKTLKSYIESQASSWTGTLSFKAITPSSVQFYVMVDDSVHSVDFLPAVDIVDSVSKNAIYEQMKDHSEAVRRYYSASLSPLQKQFVTGVPAKLKDLIRVLKYWAKEDDVPVKSYFLELLAIALWRSEHKPLNFDMDGYFKQVVQQLAQLKSLAISFDDNYKFRLYNNEVRCPYLLDPVNPYRNVAPSVGVVSVVAEKASAVLKRLA